METTKEKHATFTPGPWVIIPERNGVNIQEKETNHLVAHMTMASVPDERLIASAPEMYQLCKLLLPIMQSISDSGHCYGNSESRKGELADKLRELLAKVDGSEG